MRTSSDVLTTLRIEKLNTSTKENSIHPPILSVQHLKKYFPIRSTFFKRRIGWLKAVDGVSLDIYPGELMGLVGESGCGKSTFGKTILGMYTPNEGQISFKNKDIINLSTDEKRKMRRKIQYVYQDPAASLDSWWSVGRLLREPLAIHTKMARAEMDDKVLNLLSAVGLRGEDLYRYPHEFSGGQQKRLGLARVLTLNPELIIFDEPTAGLDVSVQAKILELLMNLKEDFKLTYIFISHNLSVVRMICNRMAVMYLGKIMEISTTEEIFNRPVHPYTKTLLEAIPQIGERKKHDNLFLTGEPPNPENLPAGCRFQSRCVFKKEICEKLEPALQEIDTDHFVACNL
jgi:oligopeptide/dipeptide ABC transporter ATP-binding protein